MTVTSLSRPEIPLCGRPTMTPECFHDASKMPPSRFQHASKPQENQQDAPRNLKDMRKIPQDAFKTLQDASKTPLMRRNIDLQSFIYASPVSTSLFDCFFSIRTRFYEHSKYRNPSKTVVFTLFQELSLVTTQVTFSCKSYLECASCSFQK